jgi:hypothetical protein
VTLVPSCDRWRLDGKVCGSVGNGSTVLSQIRLLRQMNHPNIIRIIGVVPPVSVGVCPFSLPVIT